MKLATDMLELVELPDPKKRVHYYPHQMSGGQRQRVMIAMALSCNPALLIADEPTTALDVIIQAQILDLIKRLQDETGASVMFITHDLGVVAEIADRAVVMQKGKIVEAGNVKDIFANPQHAYTQRLLNAVPRIDAEKPAPEVKKTPEVLLDVKKLRKWFPITGGVFQRTVGHVKPSTTSTCSCTRAKCSAWWANPVPARRPPAAPSCASSSRPPARWSSTVSTSPN